jgi:hypothetical protein
MAMMLRELGIPTRNVTGFVGGTYNRFGKYYAVREGDAHSWLEAYLDEAHGWVTFDPTPTGAAQPLQPMSGTYVYMRDLMEALSQRWNRYVVGYDIKTQSRLFERASQKYDQMRASRGLDKGVLGHVTKAPVVVASLAALALAGYVFWKRRARARQGLPTDPRAAKEDVELASNLYRMLEQALSIQGLTRSAAMPPLRHATSLEEKGHPLAADVLHLTHVYLETRFGGKAMSSAARRDFERRLRDIRSYRPAKQAS